MTRKRPPLTERQIEKSILAYLKSRGIFAWKAKTMGVWDAKKKIYRKPPGDYMKGVSDILGIYGGKPLAIEVKAAGGYPSEEQKYFLECFRKNGGIAFIARSIDDVEENLKGVTV